MFLHFQLKIQKKNVLASLVDGHREYVLMKYKRINWANKVHNQLIIMPNNIMLHYFFKQLKCFWSFQRYNMLKLSSFKYHKVKIIVFDVLPH